jgi:hypothetical protein
MGGSRFGDCDGFYWREKEKERARDRSRAAIMEWCSLMCLLLFFLFFFCSLMKKDNSFFFTVASREHVLDYREHVAFRDSRRSNPEVVLKVIGVTRIKM